MKTLTDMFAPYIGTKEYNGIVRTMIVWYNDGAFEKEPWCAISMSYMANKLGILDQLGGKNENVYRMMRGCEGSGKGTFKYAAKLKNGSTIRKGTILFMLKSDPPMTVGSSKHVTTAYEDFLYNGTGYVKCLGGNQSDQIKVSQYSQKTIYAIFEPQYGPETLRKGSKGPAVTELQGDLNIFGYKDAEGKKLAMDGSFGARTQYAVKQLQADQGLKVDGVCGPLTWGRIEEMREGIHRVKVLTLLNLREGPGTEHPIKKVLQEGHIFLVSRGTDWLYLPEEDGWVSAKYTEPI